MGPQGTPARRRFLRSELNAVHSIATQATKAATAARGDFYTRPVVSMTAAIATSTASEPKSTTRSVVNEARIVP